MHAFKVEHTTSWPGGRQGGKYIRWPFHAFARKRPSPYRVYSKCVSVDDGLCGHFCLCPQRGIVDTPEA